MSKENKKVNIKNIPQIVVLGPLSEIPLLNHEK